MHRGKKKPGVTPGEVLLKNGFGSVAVVGVDIPYGHSVGSQTMPRMQRGDRNLVQVTKSHGPVLNRMMTGRPH
jgi:hypothetical protein